MTDWRVTGFVPDSEDEFDDDDLESNLDITGGVDQGQSEQQQQLTDNPETFVDTVDDHPADEAEDIVDAAPSSSVAESNADGSKKVWSSQTNNGSESRSSPADLPEKQQSVNGDLQAALDQHDWEGAAEQTEKDDENNDEDVDMVDLIMHPPSTTTTNKSQLPVTSPPTLRTPSKRNQLELPWSQDKSGTDVFEFQPSQGSSQPAIDPPSPEPAPLEDSLARQSPQASSPLSPALSLTPPPSVRLPTFAVVVHNTPRSSNKPSSSDASGSPLQIETRMETMPLETGEATLPENTDAADAQALQDAVDRAMEDESFSMAGRLRHRKPIQLNPYLIEGERYRQTFKLRGLQPVRFIETTPSAQVRRSPPPDSQEEEWDASASTQLEDQEPPSSSAPVQDDEDNDLPTTEELFNAAQRQRRNSDPRVSSSGAKRRRVEAGDNPSAGGFVMPKAVRKAKALLEKTASVAKAVQMGEGRLPRDSPDPYAMPMSDDGGAALGYDTEMEQGSDGDSLPRSPDRNRRLASTPRPSVIDVRESSSDEASGDSSQERREQAQREKEKRRLQHRMKGVLPASFLTINDKIQQKKGDDQHQQRHRANSPDRNLAPRPGVARMIPRGSRPGHIPTPIETRLDSDSDASDAEPSTASGGPPKSSGTASPRPGSNKDRPILLGDSFEDNRVDMMLPRGTRTASSSNKKSSRSKRPLQQSKIRFEDMNTRKRKSLDHLHGTTKKYKNAVLRPPSRPRQRVSILDVTQSSPRSSSNKTKAPNFLRVAKRDARSRRDKGRTGPQGKFIQLEGDDEDSREVQQLLRNWREGTLPYKGTPNSVETATRNQPTQNKSYSSSGQRPQERFQRRIDGMLTGPNKPTVEKSTTPSSNRHTKPTRGVLAVVHPLANNIIQPRITQYRTTQVEHVESFRPPPVSFSRGRVDNVFDYLIQKSVEESKPSNQVQTTNKQRNPPGPKEALSASSRRAVPPQTSSTRAHPRTTRRKATPTRNIAAVVAPKAYHVSDDVPSIVESLPEDPGLVLKGLAPHGSLYSVDFDILPFREDVHFHADTFLGSGALDHALKTEPARLSGDTSLVSNGEFFGIQLCWSVFDEDVAAQFETVMRLVGDKTESVAREQVMDLTSPDSTFGDSLSFLRFISNYIYEALSFSDLIDSISFVRRVLSATEELFIRLDGLAAVVSDYRYFQFLLRTYTLSIVIIVQLQLISKQQRLPDDLPLTGVTSDILRRLIFALLKRGGLPALKECYRAQRTTERRSGIHSDNYILEAWATVHVLARGGFLADDIWTIVNSTLEMAELGKVVEVPLFENRWNVIFTLLPTMQFDSNGKVSLPKTNTNNWILVNKLLDRVITIYNSSKPLQQPKYNSYLRALYNRCFVLISTWGWTRPTAVIGKLYSFFGHNSLNNLVKEEDHGSPRFLEELGKSPSFDLEDRDLCFHILLRIVVVGLKFLRNTASANASREFIVRILPNHGRKYPKEQELKHTDLHALRNNYDLLTVIYYAAPLNERPSLELLRGLVDPVESHVAACRVSLRSWSNILTFQLSSDCNASLLVPLMEWFSNIIQKTLDQHQRAPALAKAEYQELLNRGDYSLNEQDFERVVRRNRRVFEDILLFGTGLLRHAMKEMPKNVDAMIAVMVKEATTTIFASASVLQDKLVTESLDIVQQFVSMAESFGQGSQQQPSEDSQDFGWSQGFEDAMIESDKKKAAEFLLNEIHDPLYRFLSNCFGADTSPNERVLSSTVKTWVSVIGLLVNTGLKDWDDFIDEYGKASWLKLRQTLQTRQFASKFMALVLKHSFAAYEGNKLGFIIFWLISLVERDGILKFQHELTSTLLNADSSNPLLQNPPFERNGDGIYEIRSRDFKERRISLISTVLENMRVSYEAAVLQSIENAAVLRVEYSDMLKSLMNAMKQNYLDLHSDSGSYVSFVHQIVEYLQQFTVEITPVDRFFVDSAQFPLPASDPTYVAGRLKNYGLKLDTSRTRKQLASFFHSVCERAAVDGQQSYLISQLGTTFRPRASLETMDANKPSLRLYSVVALFPAYTQLCLNSLPGRLIGGPVMAEMEGIIADLPCRVDSFNLSSVDAVLTMIACTWDSIRMSVQEWLREIPVIEISPYHLETLSMFFRILSASLPTFEWLSASRVVTDNNKDYEVLIDHSVECASYFVKLTAFLDSMLDMDSPFSHPQAAIPEFTPPPVGYVAPFERERNEFFVEMRNGLRKDWLLIGDELSAARGASRRIIPYKKYDNNRDRDILVGVLVGNMRAYLKVAARHPSLREVVVRKCLINENEEEEVWKLEKRRNLRTIRNLVIEGGLYGADYGDWRHDVNHNDDNDDDDNDDDDEVLNLSDEED